MGPTQAPVLLPEPSTYHASSTESMEADQRPIKRRVRTGCLTCRTRRRKCDEGKPNCRNCITKRLDCRYASRITFATPWTGPADPAPASSERTTQHEAGENQVTGINHAAAISHSEPSDSAKVLESNGGNFYAGTRPDRTSFDIIDDFGVDNSGFESLERFSTSTTAGPVAILRSNDEAGPIATRETISSEHGRPDFSRVPCSIDNSSMQLITELNCYRDQLANIMDLDMTDAFWGIEVLHLSTRSSQVKEAIFDVTRHCMQRARSDTHTPSFQPSSELDDSYSQESNRVATLLRTLDMILSYQPTTWSAKMRDLGLRSWLDETHSSMQQFGHRILLAAMLDAPLETLGKDRPLDFAAPSVFHYGPPRSSATQLKQSLCLLGRCLYFLPPTCTRAEGSMPLNSAWLMCWSEAQIWYHMRSEDLRPLFESFGFSVDASPRDGYGADVPHLISTNGLALVANAAHHLTALLLLQQKPRVLQAIAEPASSASPSWHALCLVGIAAAATHLGFWDPLIATSVVKAAQKLSHPSQLAAASRILQRLCAISGMRFDAEIRTLEDLASMDYSDAF